MKIFYFLIIIVVLFIGNCIGKKSSKVNNTIITNPQNIISKKININDFLGEWELTKSIISDYSVDCNICSKVVFSTDSKGYFIKPSRERFEFYWTLSDNKIIFTFKNNFNNAVLFDKENICFFEIINKNILVLSSVTKKNKYFLYRTPVG